MDPRVTRFLPRLKHFALSCPPGDLLIQALVLENSFNPPPLLLQKRSSAMPARCTYSRACVRRWLCTCCGIVLMVCRVRVRSRTVPDVTELHRVLLTPTCFRIR